MVLSQSQCRLDPSPGHIDGGTKNQIMRSSWLKTVSTVTTVLYILWLMRNSSGISQDADTVSSEGVLGQVGSLPFVTFFSLKTPGMFLSKCRVHAHKRSISEF